MTYRAPLTEQLFVLETIGEIDQLGTLPAFEGMGSDVAAAVLDETRKLAEQQLYPINQTGDCEGATWTDGDVRLPAGFTAAYRTWIGGGWNGIEAPAQFGGHALPLTLSAAVQEQMFAANVALSQLMGLTAGAVRAIAAHGSDTLQAAYLPKLVSGEWSGTMNLTEPQAGSDVGALRTTAVPAGDGSYRIKGSKIFITFGEHDATENIVHLVLARIAGAPAGTRGISLFLVPKFLSDSDGRPERRNDVRCTGIEHKLGMRGSATASLSYGDNGACVGFLVGEEQGGMRAMFTMMNHARIGVGLQGVGVAAIAFQKAVDYARERVQSAAIEGDGSAVAIIAHPDVRRMLMTMRAKVEAARALAVYTSLQVDRGHADIEPTRVAAANRAELLTPCTKAYCTDVALEVSSIAVQVFGGVGFIEETGVAQHYRDARILPIYEGTNGIQALDLVRRKLRFDGGEAWRGLIHEIKEAANAWRATPELSEGAALLTRAAGVLRTTSERLLDGPMLDAAAGATPYLRMFSLVTCGWLLARQAEVAGERLSMGCGDSDFLCAKLATVSFYLTQLLPEVFSLEYQVLAGCKALFAAPAAALAA
jgi:3-(methylthio)propanoyl-CoA dehydrogenase